ncbi:hypothetical protein [Corynebacterium flavescens]|uniref:DUF4230 domain-containing protein n=3 Tax=Corynebacterium flavescens TaxID=28028 RepID=A0A1L7CNS9_CORFL|nr:hypothetical protein [Corynebacterium flavescens]APT87481.1 hypothetical protein CFLV_10115 [Corynebacterium flavescens]KAA8720295.1 hypothetical protein F4V60_09800 [Corynebacterium flavescens]GEB97021.1 hypothetical protein CFL01nite_05160 [Corynebacterium flavescens]
MKTVLTAVLTAIIVGAVAIAAIVFLKPQFGMTTQSESTNTQVIKSVEREEQVVLVSLGIQGLNRQSENRALWGMQVPGSARTQFIQYDYKAKLGIEGKDVRIEETGENAYKIAVPAFIFIGHADEHFEKVIDDNGLLSWVTDEIDPAQRITEILQGGEQEKNIADNRELLQDQARQFYTDIITAIEPTAQLEFSFA